MHSLIRIAVVSDKPFSRINSYFMPPINKTSGNLLNVCLNSAPFRRYALQTNKSYLESFHNN